MANPLGNDCEKLTHIHMVVYTWWCWHIYKGDEVRVDVDQLGEETKTRKVPQSGPDSGHASDRTLRASVRSVVADSMQRRSVDRTLMLEVSGRWQGASS